MDQVDARLFRRRRVLASDSCELPCGTVAVTLRLVEDAPRAVPFQSSRDGRRTLAGRASTAAAAPPSAATSCAAAAASAMLPAAVVGGSEAGGVEAAAPRAQGQRRGQGQALASGTDPSPAPAQPVQSENRILAESLRPNPVTADWQADAPVAREPDGQPGGGWRLEGRGSAELFPPWDNKATVQDTDGAASNRERRATSNGSSSSISSSIHTPWLQLCLTVPQPGPSATFVLDVQDTTASGDAGSGGRPHCRHNSGGGAGSLDGRQAGAQSSKALSCRVRQTTWRPLLRIDIPPDGAAVAGFIRARAASVAAVGARMQQLPDKLWETISSLQWDASLRGHGLRGSSSTHGSSSSHSSKSVRDSKPLGVNPSGSSRSEVFAERQRQALHAFVDQLRRAAAASATATVGKSVEAVGRWNADRRSAAAVVATAKTSGQRRRGLKELRRDVDRMLKDIRVATVNAVGRAHRTLQKTDWKQVKLQITRAPQAAVVFCTAALTTLWLDFPRSLLAPTTIPRWIVSLLSLRWQQLPLTILNPMSLPSSDPLALGWVAGSSGSNRLRKHPDVETSSGGGSSGSSGDGGGGKREGGGRGGPVAVVVGSASLPDAIHVSLVELEGGARGKRKAGGGGGGSGWPRTFNVPVEGGWLTSYYGWRDGRPYFHHGIDIAVEEDTVITAAASGQVSFVGWRGGYGKVVHVDHGDGSMTLYAHCNRFLTRRGQAVRKGQPIALSGNTGNSTGPHLHFEIHMGGETVDPLMFLPELDEEGRAPSLSVS